MIYYINYDHYFIVSKRYADYYQVVNNDTWPYHEHCWYKNDGKYGRIHIDDII